MYELDKIETFKYEEIAKYLINDKTPIFISEFNLKRTKKQSFALETSVLKSTDSNEIFFINLLNISDSSIDLSKYNLSPDEIELLSDFSRSQFYHCKDVKQLTVGQLRLKAQEVIDQIKLTPNYEDLSEFEIREMIGAKRYCSYA